MIVQAPFLVALTTASPASLVPAAKLANSKTPIGPFQITVLAREITSVLSLLVSGPQSRPRQPAGIPVSRVATPTLASAENLLPVTKSRGRWTLTFLAFAFAMIFGTSLAPASSNKELPISIP
eukprot:Lithocolla_globosa_v1_NODE_3007_length_1796_cov_20.351522.p2 type:complete len:123 gc:universal NODE_3007_length_1796_cov_20.351522:1314-946(-)